MDLNMKRSGRRNRGFFMRNKSSTAVEDLFLMKNPRFLLPLLFIFISICAAPSCTPSDNNNSNDNQLKSPGRIQWVQFYDPLKPQAINPPINLRSARNETISFALQINSFNDLNTRRPSQLRLAPLQSAGATVPVHPTAWQVVPMPIDTNRAAFARHTGLPVGLHHMPRALLPLAIEKGAINLATLRDPENATNPQSHPWLHPAMVWFDVQIPAA